MPGTDSKLSGFTARTREAGREHARHKGAHFHRVPRNPGSAGKCPRQPVRRRKRGHDPRLEEARRAERGGAEVQRGDPATIHRLDGGGWRGAQSAAAVPHDRELRSPVESERAPAADRRIYRYGQTKPVVVYNLRVKTDTHQHTAVCCNPNATRVASYYTAGMWMRPRGAEPAVAAVLYGPSQMTANIAGAAVTIEEKTLYPYSGEVDLTVRPARPVSFCLWLRTRPGRVPHRSPVPARNCARLADSGSCARSGAAATGLRSVSSRSSARRPPSMAKSRFSTARCSMCCRYREPPRPSRPTRGPDLKIT